MYSRNQKDWKEEFIQHPRTISVALASIEETIFSNDLKQAINLLLKIHEDNQRVFVLGEGRSGLVGEAFAMRLRQLRFHAHVIGESTAPAVRKFDLVIIVSGSGETTTNVTRTKIIKKQIGTKIILITRNEKSTLRGLADIVIQLPGNKKSVSEYIEKSLIGGPPMGTLFETIALIVCDAIISVLMLALGITEEEMKAEHSV